ncbi:hypothetical protein [Kribbella sp. NPDC048928]|uniref:hypothetical protein n=1 Tax=Kribbella sp. NPDC048928 TaxID=3364111 RepID=UPI0037208B29
MVRRTLALVAALAAATVIALLTTAVPAQAGGPTSVLLSAPPSIAAFGYDDPRYAEFQALTEPAGAATPGPHDIGRFVRATWLIHDMSVWRIDMIYPNAPGGPWILTANTLAEAGPAKATWHRSSNPAKLIQLLKDLKLLSGEFQGGPALQDGFALPQSTQPLQTAEPTPAPPAQTQVSTTPNAFTGWRWILPGILLGAAATALALRLYPKRRWELLG